MSKEPSDPGFERLRIMIGLGLIVVCGTILWQQQLKPVLLNPKTNVWEARDKVRDKYLEWVQEQRLREKREALKAELDAANRSQADRPEEKKASSTDPQSGAKPRSNQP